MHFWQLLCPAQADSQFKSDSDGLLTAKGHLGTGRVSHGQGQGQGDNISQWNFPRPMSWPNVVVFANPDVMDATLNCFPSEPEREPLTFSNSFSESCPARQKPRPNWQCRGLPLSWSGGFFGFRCGLVLGFRLGTTRDSGPDIFIVCRGTPVGNAPLHWLHFGSTFHRDTEYGIRAGYGLRQSNYNNNPATSTTTATMTGPRKCLSA